MHKLVARAAIVSVVLFLFYLFPLGAAAGGIGVGPSRLEVQEALRGSEYERLLTVFNPGAETTSYLLNATGEAGDWISFSLPNAPETPIDAVDVPAGGEQSVLATITIPPDAANGVHEAVIEVSTVPAEQSGAQAVALSTQATVTITVTGTQVLSGAVNSISSRDIETGYPLRVGVHFQNTGNVEATPQIAVEITKDGVSVDSFSYDGTKVKPETSEQISVEWATTGLGPGDYVARVVVSLAGEVVAEDELSFIVLPVGTLTRHGALTQLDLLGEPKAGTITKLQAIFLNSGEIDTRAKLVGEVYRDGELVGVLDSEEILVPVGERETLISYLTLDSPGNYMVKGHILYEGKRTDAVEYSFAVVPEMSGTPAPGPSTGGDGLRLDWVPQVVGVLAVLVLAGATLRTRKPRLKTQGRRNKRTKPQL